MTQSRVVRVCAAAWRSGCALVLFGLGLARAHVPVPDSVLDPKTPAEAWNVVRLSTGNVARLLKENRLVEVPDQISLCSPALRALPKWAQGPPERQRQAAAEAMQASLSIGSLAQASAVGDRTTSETMLATLRGQLASLAIAYDPATVRADIFCCPMHPDFVSADPAAHCAKCGMSLVARRIPYSFVYVPPGEPSIRMTASSDQPPQAGQLVHVTLHLARQDGSPVLLPDLLTMHTQPIHLLIVDRSLEDYHHEHPTPTSVPGEYAFSFTPAKSAGYRIFADLVPGDSGMQEFPFVDLPGAETVPAPPVRGSDTRVATAGGWNFQLTADNVRASRVCALHIAVSRAVDGVPCSTLEPVMGAFAHLVGFYDDHRTVVHIHPQGNEITDASARGGPGLELRFYPPKAGFLRLFCQVQVDGKPVFAPFDLNVAP